MVRRFQLRPTSRLCRNADFLQIRSIGKPYRCQYFALFSRIRTPEVADVLCPRIGISAARRVGNSVTRNKIKRRFKELFRLHQHQIRSEADIVLSLRFPAGLANYQDLEQRFLHALKYRGLLKTSTNSKDAAEEEE
ncbi:ribonuclease P protein component [Pelagicoccus albus]|uniref:Ribonuclease P protein component n=1 Tax=Pelagicoccus albus TaxID=415222 RepID=A0A7X1BAB0_9BACT|nr:ribonuclease P protein component [Pelagicoccus albus]MBC2607245.1 ribonuclease P protein component [Pelagicoccus albus]